MTSMEEMLIIPDVGMTTTAELARVLGLGEHTVIYKLKEHGIGVMVMYGEGGGGLVNLSEIFLKIAAMNK